MFGKVGMKRIIYDVNSTHPKGGGEGKKSPPSEGGLDGVFDMRCFCLAAYSLW